MWVEEKADRLWLHGLLEYTSEPNMTVIELEVEGEPEYPEVRFT